LRKVRLAFLWMMSTAATALAGQPQLTIRLFDYTGLPASALQETAARAGEILGNAGVEAEWRLCYAPANRGACGLPTNDEGLIFRVISSRGPAGVFGVAVKPVNGQPTGVYATIYYGRVREAAERRGAPASVLLACAIAHEAGELLGLTHAPEGIMHAVFDNRDLDRAAVGLLAFSESQRRQLRDAVWSRGQLLAAIPGKSVVLK
jgi:hypothetical protein